MSHTSDVANHIPFSYRRQLTSTKIVSSLFIHPPEVAGNVLKALRGCLLVHRGIKNVLDVVFVDGVIREKSCTNNNNNNKFQTELECDDQNAIPGKLLLLDPRFGIQSEYLKAPCHANPSSLLKLDDLILYKDFWKPIFHEEIIHNLEKGIFTNEKKAKKKPSKINSIDEEERKEKKEEAASLELTVEKTDLHSSIKLAMASYEISLSYQNYTMPEILKRILPETENNKKLTALSGFEQVGHIAHVNLSANHLPYRFDIGEVIIDSNPTVQVVVNKVDSISSIFREFKMEIIGKRIPNTFQSVSPVGKETSDELKLLLTASVKQHGFIFEVPYDKVYWNSRLSSEHDRLVENIQSDDILFDVMAGVGPFAIPAARKGITVYANDLNPVAAEYMPINAKINHLPISTEKNFTDDKKLHVFNLDGRDFMNTVLFSAVNEKKNNNDAFKGRIHIVMNLPAIAVQFLDIFSPQSKESPWPRITEAGSEYEHLNKVLLIHVYCFCGHENPLAEGVQQVEHYIGYKLEKNNIENVFMVRDVAPTKRMVCVSFALPSKFWGGNSLEQDFPPNKKAKS